jgi:hypothetical protein
MEREVSGSMRRSILGCVLGKMALMRKKLSMALSKSMAQKNNYADRSVPSFPAIRGTQERPDEFCIFAPQRRVLRVR